jgi:hypothetical protein
MPGPMKTRKDRLAEALRENLKKRKAQARARSDEKDVDATRESPPQATPRNSRT